MRYVIWGRYLGLGLLILSCFRCSEAPDTPLITTFYHWETILAPDSTAKKLLSNYACDRLYVKAFDVAWQASRPEPTALVQMRDTTALPTLVPVVFITNEVFKNEPQAQLIDLADNIVGLVEELFPADFPELQIDCDWTARTQVPYFVFLKAVQARLGPRALTCTVRLHQYRDVKEQGVPPVTRATLMAYNVGDLNLWATDNSIIDTTILKHYLAGTAPYPIQLDLALAVYDWAAVYRRQNLAYLINEPLLTELQDSVRFLELTDEGLRYEVRQSTYLDGIYLYTGDRIRREVASPDMVDQQTKLLQRYVPGFAG
ncbi:MAG: hypothetical protein AAF840_08725, partial [Bacteroidota bacterium]